MTTFPPCSVNDTFPWSWNKLRKEQMLQLWRCLLEIFCMYGDDSNGGQKRGGSAVVNGALSRLQLTATALRVWMKENPSFPNLACPSVFPEIEAFFPCWYVHIYVCVCLNSS